MENKFPRSFYFKIIFIMVVSCFVYISNHSFIQATLHDESLNVSESFTLIMKEVMGLPNVENTSSQELITVPTLAEPGNQTPYLLSEEVKSHPNYQLASEAAEQFNHNFQPTAVNDAFLKRVNHARQNRGWGLLDIGYHLEAGTQERAFQLGQYHYLSGLTVEDEDFRALFPNLENAYYRLGENLYELYISAGDIHLTTWENPRILADYLYDVFGDSIIMSNYDVYTSQYVWVYAEPTDYMINDVPYVRLVVTLVLDAANN